MVLLPHIVDLHPGKGAVGQSPFNGKARVIGVDMDLDHILVGDYYHTVPQGFQIALEAVLLFFPIFFFYINDKLRTVAEFNIRSIDLFPSGCRRTGVAAGLHLGVKGDPPS